MFLSEVVRKARNRIKKGRNKIASGGPNRNKITRPGYLKYLGLISLSMGLAFASGS